MRKHILFLSLALVFVPLFVATTHAKPFYEGKVIKIIAATKPGGGYDWYARFMAQFMKKYLPGSTVIVKNVPGAGHIIGTNEMYVSKPNGLTIATFNRAVGMAQVVGFKGVKFDFGNLSWLGSPTDEVYCFIANPKKYKNLDDVLKADKKVRLASTGLGTVSYLNPLVLFQALGFKNYSIGTGYSGAEMQMALLRGEADAIWSSFYSRKPIIDSGEGRVVLFIGKKKPPGFEHVPFIEDVLKGEKYKPVVNLLRGIQLVGRPFAGPPGIPKDRLKILQEAFKKACNDPEALKIAKKAERPMNYIGPEEAEAWAKGLLQLPPQVVATVKRAYGVK
ncbi:MAG: Bug family tripartite tricarboxylate transporter substrate binding protein [Thermodesulfobacteriota bacterium]